MGSWDPTARGVLELPSGRLVRGRGVRRPPPEGPLPEFSVLMLRDRPPDLAWETRWLPWPDFGLPVDPTAMAETLREVWRRAAAERVEVACLGGRGRTGTALACLAVLDGVPPADAVRYVRRRYHRLAVETPGQVRFVRRFRDGWDADRGEPG